MKVELVSEKVVSIEFTDNERSELLKISELTSLSIVEIVEGQLCEALRVGGNVCNDVDCYHRRQARLDDLDIEESENEES